MKTVTATLVEALRTMHEDGILLRAARQIEETDRKLTAALSLVVVPPPLVVPLGYRPEGLTVADIEAGADKLLTLNFSDGDVPLGTRGQARSTAWDIIEAAIAHGYQIDAPVMPTHTIIYNATRTALGMQLPLQIARTRAVIEAVVARRARGKPKPSTLADRLRALDDGSGETAIADEAADRIEALERSLRKVLFPLTAADEEEIRAEAKKLLGDAP